MRSKINSRYCFIKQPTLPKRNNNQSNKQVINRIKVFQNNRRRKQSDSFLTPGVLKGKRTLVDIKTQPYPLTIHACLSARHPLTVFPISQKPRRHYIQICFTKNVSYKRFTKSVSQNHFSYKKRSARTDLSGLLKFYRRQQISPEAQTKESNRSNRTSGYTISFSSLFNDFFKSFSSPSFCRNTIFSSDG